MAAPDQLPEHRTGCRDNEADGLFAMNGDRFDERHVLMAYCCRADAALARATFDLEIAKRVRQPFKSVGCIVRAAAAAFLDISAADRSATSVGNPVARIAFSIRIRAALSTEVPRTGLQA
jgi:hypothetical protein